MLHLAIVSIVKHDGPLKTFTFGPTAIETTNTAETDLFNNFCPFQVFKIDLKT